MSHISTHPVTQSAAVIGAALACALGTPVTSAHARTFEFGPIGTMIQQPLPSEWWCAEKSALLDRDVRCDTAAPAVGFRLPGLFEKERRWLS
ncbi:MAG: hypothetical protein ACRDK8_07570 [Solirubrobacteraceae bacterium]